MTYTVVKDAIVADMQKKYKFGTDIAKSLRNGKKFDIKKEKPKRELGVLKQTKDCTLNDAKKEKVVAQRQKGLDMEYEPKCICLLKENICSRKMKQRLSP